MQHIQHEFNDAIQYVCTSSPNESQTSRPLMYIQIILRKTINKKVRFLHPVAGSNQLTFFRILAQIF